jgi:GntR family transcriptional regulator/MocR family aminotransferase
VRDFLFHLRRSDHESLQGGLRQLIVSAILDGQLPAGESLPSSRKLAKQLGIARNTVMLTYQRLMDDGFLVSRERSGYYVNRDIVPGRATVTRDLGPRRPEADVGWTRRFKLRPSAQHNISKPLDWQSFRYPFIYGQLDRGLFPIAEWRECSRQALGRMAINAWTADSFYADDPLLLEQLRTRVLPRRGVRASEDEILITVGAQNALYLLAALLVGAANLVGFENPGYVDARNILRLHTPRVLPIPVDDGGMALDDRFGRCDYVYVTPSHQFPTTVTMPLERRNELLERAYARDVVVIEDDYENEINYRGDPTPALKSIDGGGRVIYVSSLSKILAPGLRLGYMVGPPGLIAEARALRRLMLRHPPSNNQHTVALFMANGHYDSLIHRLQHVYRDRWKAMDDALRKCLPDSSRAPTFGGSAYWVRGPEGLDAAALAEAAKREGVLIEPGAVHFAADDPPRNYFRLGFSSIAAADIEPGIRILARLIESTASAVP